MSVLNLIERISQFSLEGLGTTRWAYSPEDRLAREIIAGEMIRIGMSVREDEIGNLFGRLPGTEEGALPVALGSHLDTVPEGGNYDGILGVVGALAAVERLQQEGAVFKNPVEVIVFAAEESSRFNVATMGSKAMAGRAPIEQWCLLKDKQGMTFEEALNACGLKPDQLSGVIRKAGEWKAFLELHIEQGPVLEKEGLEIGVVQAIVGLLGLKVVVKGQAGHAGTTPMVGRRDALVSASHIIQAVQEVGLSESDLGTVATIGEFKVFPGAMNVIPGRVEIWIDLRSIDEESLMRAFQTLKDEIADICAEAETGASIEVLYSEKPVPMSGEIVDLLKNICEKEKISYRLMPSGAGHDAMNMAELTNAGMIFIPCRDGLSHHPEEYASPEDMERGIRVLMQALRELAC